MWAPTPTFAPKRLRIHLRQPCMKTGEGLNRTSQARFHAPLANRSEKGKDGPVCVSTLCKILGLVRVQLWRWPVGTGLRTAGE